MELPFTHKPGRRERHLLRRHQNPLFGWPPQEVDPQELLAAQKADHEDMEAFLGRYRELVARAAELPPDAGSDTVLSLKEALEQQYEQSHALPEDHRKARAAIKRLIDLIMKSLWRQAAADPVAHQELSDEETARAIHFQLLEHALVADLLHDASCISAEELAPTLLSVSDAEVQATCELFGEPELMSLVHDCEVLLGRLADAGVATPDATRRLGLVRRRLQQYSVGPSQHEP